MCVPPNHRPKPPRACVVMSSTPGCTHNFDLGVGDDCEQHRSRGRGGTIARRPQRKVHGGGLGVERGVNGEQAWLHGARPGGDQVGWQDQQNN